MSERVSVLGAGAWGTAVAHLLADKGHEVLIWCHEDAVVESINKKKCNELYLPNVVLPNNIRATNDIRKAVCSSNWIFEAIPVPFLRETLTPVVDCVTDQQIWIVLSKGIEQETFLLSTQIIDELFAGKTNNVVFSGPSFARDLVQKDCTAVTIASADRTIACTVQRLVAHDYFRSYVSADPIGSQVCGALKNVITLGVGLLKGAGYKDNAQAFLFTHGLIEMGVLVDSFGGKKDTVYGLSGVGDLVLTAMGESSRNVALGKRLGSGDALADISKEKSVLPEGINTVKSIRQYMQRNNLNLPIFTGIYEVIFEEKTVGWFLHGLISAPLEFALCDFDESLHERCGC